MKKLIIAVHRQGYATDQVGRTMTVGELMEYLSQFDEDMPVFTSHDSGYTYGGISEWDFDERDENESEDDSE